MSSSATSSSHPLTALIVGCGQIAGGFDERAESPGDAVLTHAGAYSRHPEFMIAACVEPDTARRQAFMDYWGVPVGFSTLEGCLRTGMAFDVVSVCAPTPLHGSLLEKLLTAPVRAVFCEKPLTDDLERSRYWVREYEESGKLLAVNYLRRWTPGITALRDELASGAWGGVISAMGSYVKGLLNNGSHLVDLLHYLLGPSLPVAALESRHDFFPKDPTVDAVLRLEQGGLAYLVGGDARAFTLFELTLIMEKGRIVVENSGRSIRRQRVGEDPQFAGYRILEPGEIEETGLGQAMPLAVENLRAALREKAPLASTGRTALEAQEVCAHLLRLWEQSRSDAA
ncbi:MAG: Gfo/Idh/MocA family oxidoreductase [Magnetococcales bacterium]|nr:Gfo/Idh/MocA family oxidoreductase [Magnetococcales bacterium]